MRAHPYLAVTALLAAIAGVNLLTLMRYPQPFVDEGWLASRAWALLHTGRAFSSLDHGVWDRYEGYWTFPPLLGTWFQALGIQVLGLSLFSVRLVSLAFGLVLLLIVFTIGKTLYGQRTGLLAVLLVATSMPFQVSAHWARHDVIVAAFAYGALALFVTEQRDSRYPIRSLGAGLALGLAFEVNPNAVIFIPAMCTLYLLAHGRSFLSARRLWAFAVGLGAGFAFFVAVHVAPYPQTYLAIMSLSFTSWRTPPLLIWDVQVWQRAVSDMWWLMVWAMLGAQLPVLAAAIALLARRRANADRLLLSFSGVVLLAFIALLSFKSTYYAILFGPALSLIAAVFLDGLSRTPWRISRSPWAFLGTAVPWSLTLAVMFLGQIIPFTADQSVDLPAVGATLRQVVRPGETAMGSQTYWLCLPDRKYLSWGQLVYYRHYAPGSTLGDALREFRPDIFIIDGQMDDYIASEKPQNSPLREYLYLPQAELETFLHTHASLVASIDTQYLGPMRIYRIDWGSD